MLFEQRFWEPIARGDVTVTFRRWKRRQAIAGNRYRTAQAIIEADAVDVVTLEDITDADARAGGYPDVETLVADLRGTPDLDLYRIRFHAVDEPDPRATLAANATLGDDDRGRASTPASTGSIGRAAMGRGRARPSGYRADAGDPGRRPRR